jgi:putative DNA methylase
MKKMKQLTLFPEEKPRTQSTKLEYIKDGIVAEGHTPVYKMHKYFARRPHNVFRRLIEHYSMPGDLILDTFCGGGVTVVEGVFAGRKTIGVDINPLATFVTNCQLSRVDLQRVNTILQGMWVVVEQLTTRLFVTRCRHSGEQVNARWYDLTYSVECPRCKKETSLANDNKTMRNGVARNGSYVCCKCKKDFKAVDAKRLGDILLSVTYREPSTGNRVSHPVDAFDMELLHAAEEELICKQAQGLWLPGDEIPASWDRQQEDCLHRKSITRFTDLFTPRTLLVVSSLFDYILKKRQELSPSEFEILVFGFSAFIRFTNRLTMSTSNWMDGRPVAWAKHAYWVPNQFVEVNPIEYVEKRATAIKSGLVFQRRNTSPPELASDFGDLTSKDCSHLLITGSSESIPIPSSSIDLVLTDPPYGSNVQYGELSSYWNVWLKKALQWKDVDAIGDEAVVHRKQKSEKSKDFGFYYSKLRSIFGEAYRVLKPGRPLVFTFNNKDIRSWLAVIKAVVDSGFILDQEGVIYQEPIENYKNTAHTRHHGTVHGDFVYTFVKPATQVQYTEWKRRATESFSFERVVMEAASSVIDSSGAASTSAVYIRVFADLIPHIVSVAESTQEISPLLSNLSFSSLDKVLAQQFIYDKTTKNWKRNERIKAGSD